MSKNYSIEIKLDVAFSQESVQKVLQGAIDSGFILYDHIMGERYEESPVLNSLQATKKVFAAYEKKDLNFEPCVYTTFDNDSSSVHLWFYKSDEGYLEFHAASFGGIKKKGLYIDFSYYIPLFLGVCFDFPVLGVRADIYG